MKTTIRYWLLLASFSILLGLGIWTLEAIEGSKIKDTLHTDFGILLLFYGFIVGVLISIIVILPLTHLIQRYIPNTVVRLIVYPILGLLLGKIVFQMSFLDLHVQEYELYELTSVIIFITVGFIYCIIDEYTYRKWKTRIEQN